MAFFTWRRCCAATCAHPSAVQQYAEGAGTQPLDAGGHNLLGVVVHVAEGARHLALGSIPAPVPRRPNRYDY